MTPLPFWTDGLAGTGGRLKARPDHFVVDEIALYEPSGTGDHVWLVLRREGWTTRALERLLADVAGVDRREVGTAGLKDKQARVTQVFTVKTPAEPDAIAAALQDREPALEVLSASRHDNKIRTGHLLGNRFDVVVSDLPPEAVSRARPVVEALAAGHPNAFGPQRFGGDGENVARGLDVLAGRGKASPWLRKLLVSSVQSDLFNRWLIDRVAGVGADRVVLGDVARTARGGLFVVDDEARDAARCAAGEIVATGPMFGRKMMRAEGSARAAEDAVLDDAGMALTSFGRAPGSRRAAWVQARDLELADHAEGLRLAFSLPKGSYATVVLREIMKVEVT